MDLLSVYLAFLSLAFAVTVVIGDFCDIPYTVAVSKQRKESYVGTCYYKTSCGWWGRRCTRSRDCTQYKTTVYYEADTRTRKGCCGGYTGVNCNIPVCTNCKNNAVCTAPGVCYCRPGTTGATCTLVFCSASNDCYPGTCSNDNSCICSSGFSGTSCSNIIEGGSLRACSLNLEVQQGVELGTSFTGDCTKDQYGNIPSHYSNTVLPSKLHLSYEVEFPIPADLPPLPSEYMVAAPFGLIESHAELSMYNSANIKLWGPIKVPCVIDVSQGQSQPGPDNPHKSLNCHDLEYNWPAKVSTAHGNILKIELVSTSGGYKEYIDSSITVHKRQYTGSTARSQAQVVFDLMPPDNCVTTNSCPSTKPYACEFVPDVSKHPRSRLDFGGWIDSDSGLKEYKYSVHYMEVDNSGLLVERSEHIAETTIPTYSISQEIEFTYPGVYSAIFQSVDSSGNIAKARALYLYDNSSSIYTDSAYPIKIEGAALVGSVHWITSLDATVTVSWKNRYSNRFLHDNKLLAQVEPRSDVTFDDQYGMRQASQIDNTDGISQFRIAFNTDNTDASSGKFTELPPSVQEYTQTVSFAGNNVMYLKLVATDILGNSQSDQIMLRMDNTQAVLHDTMVFTQNVNTTISGIPYASSLTLFVEDRESGIQSIDYSLMDITHTGSDTLIYTDSQPGQSHVKHTTASACTASGECYCVPGINCFTHQQVIWINNCQMKGLDGRDFRLDFNVVNGANLEWPSPQSYTIGILENLKGIGYYPPLQNVRAIEVLNNVYQMNITWNYAPVCYRILDVMVVYTAGTNTKTFTVAATQTSAVIDGLRPLTEYTIALSINYEGGQQRAKVDISFLTGDDGHVEEQIGDEGKAVFSTGVWIGIGVGAVVVLTLIILITVVIVRFHQNKQIIPPTMRETGRQIRDRLSRLSHAGAHGNLHAAARPPASIQTANRAYVRNPYEYDEPYGDKGPQPKTKTFKIAYPEEEKDDFYSYGDAGPADDTAWKVHAKDTVKLGDPLPEAKGKFADIILSKLKKSSGTENVIVKLNKVGATASDRSLMGEKMAFLGRVETHGNIVNFIAAVPPPEGPMIILEYCENGKLLTWLKGVSTVTSAVEDKMNSYAEQVARGMCYLHKNEILHKRLGARNVLLKTDSRGRDVAKLTGFGPARGDKASDIVEPKGDRVILKWMAPEQFHRARGTVRHYDKHTDVWSYGIFLHEVYTRGTPPYEGMSDKEMMAQVKNGYRMVNDKRYTKSLYDGIMIPCWASEPKKRPNFDTLVASMGNYISNMVGEDDHYAYGTATTSDDLYQNN